MRTAIAGRVRRVTPATQAETCPVDRTGCRCNDGPPAGNRGAAPCGNDSARADARRDIQRRPPMSPAMLHSEARPTAVPLTHRARLWLEDRSPASIEALAFALLVAVTALDALTPPQVSLALLYIVPLGLATWLGRPGAGWRLMLVAAMAWTGLDLLQRDSYPFWVLATAVPEKVVPPGLRHERRRCGLLPQPVLLEGHRRLERRRRHRARAGAGGQREQHSQRHGAQQVVSVHGHQVGARACRVSVAAARGLRRSRSMQTNTTGVV